MYIDNNRLFKYHKIIFNNSIFNNNQGISVYVINYKFYINGKVFFTTMKQTMVQEFISVITLL